MALSAGTISLAVKPDTSKFGSDMKSGIMGKVGGVGESMGGAILGGLKKFAGPIAAVTAAFSVKHLVDDSVHAFEDLAGSVKGIQRVTGGTTEEVSKMRGAMQLAGVDVEAAGTSMTIFAKKLGLAGQDAKKTAAMNDLFGQSIKDAHGAIKPMSELLPGLADKFAKMPNGAEKTALATTLFGRAGTQMIPVLNKGSAGIAELTDKAEKMGLVLNDKAMKSFAESRESARNFNAAIQGVKVAIGQSLLPVLDAFQNMFRGIITPLLLATTGYLHEHQDGFIKAGEGVSEFGKKIGEYLAPIMKQAGAAFKQLGPVFQSLVPELLKLATSMSPVHTIFEALKPVLPALISLIVNLAVSLGGTLANVLKQILPSILQLSQILVGALSGIIVKLMPTIIKLAESLGSFLGKAIQTLAPVVVMLVNAVISLLPPLMPLIDAVISLAIEAFMPLLQAVMPLVQAILPILVDLLEFIIPIITGLAQVLIAILVPILKFVIDIFKNVAKWVTHAIGVFTDIIKFIPKVAEGFRIVFGKIGGFVSDAFNNAVSLVKSGINFIIDQINHAIDALNSLAGGLKDISGGAINLTIGHVPHLAQGGVVPATPGGRLVRVAEAGQAEAVIPLNRLGEMTGAQAPAERPIYADGIGLLGWVRQVANGESKLVFNTQLANISRGAR